MSSAEAFHVNQYQWQEIELESQKNPDQVSFTNSCDGDKYKDAQSEDMRLMNKAQESRIANGFNWTKKCED